MSDKDSPQSERIQLMASFAVVNAFKSTGHFMATARAMQDIVNVHNSFDVNEELIHEQFARHNRGEHLDLNINQEQALLIAWLDQRRYQQIAFIRQQALLSEEAMQVALRYGFLTWADDDSRDVVWHQDRAEMQGWPIIQKIFQETFNVGELPEAGNG